MKQDKNRVVMFVSCLLIRSPCFTRQQFCYSQRCFSNKCCTQHLIIKQLIYDNHTLKSKTTRSFVVNFCINLISCILYALAQLSLEYLAHKWLEYSPFNVKKKSVTHFRYQNWESIFILWNRTKTECLVLFLNCYFCFHLFSSPWILRKCTCIRWNMVGAATNKIPK